MARTGCRCESGWKSRTNYVVTRRLVATVPGTGEEVPSKNSEVKCLLCGGKWRTCAVYVASLRDHCSRKYRRLTEVQVLALILNRRIRVNPVTGVVKKQRRVAGWNVVARWRNEWVTLVQHFDRNGYPYVRIQYNGHRRGLMVHRLVWMTVKKQVVPEGYDVDHRDRNRGNPCIRNLRLRLINHNRGKHDEETPF